MSSAPSPHNKTPVGFTGSLLAGLAALRVAAGDFIDLFAIEGRLASLRAIRIIVLAVSAGLMITMVWLFLLIALALWLIDTYDWKWSYVFCMFAFMHAIAAAIMLKVTYRNATARFFPATLGQFRDDPNTAKPVDLIGLENLQRQREYRESSLEDKKRMLAAQLAEAKATAKGTLVKPMVLAGAIGAGLLLGMSGKSGAKFRGKLNGGKLVSTATFLWQSTRLGRGPLASLALSTAMKAIAKRRARQQAERYRPDP